MKKVLLFLFVAGLLLAVFWKELFLSFVVITGKFNDSENKTKMKGKLAKLSLKERLHIIQQIENHNFDSIQKIYWRNSDLDFNSIEKLLSSLKKYPVQNFFIHKKNALDEVNFRNLINDNEIKQKLISAN